MKNLLRITISLLAGAIITAAAFYLFVMPKASVVKRLSPYQANIVKMTADNTDFRRVLFTGARSQLVVMSIPPGSEVGEETHKHVEQILYFQSGTAEAIMDGKVTPIVSGDVVVVTPGTVHNFRNTGSVPLQITTTYAPPNHLDGRVHRTKAEADADLADEAFGEAQQ
jgi:mannose-6-phosphate isomerase-like protein (cupin superfamily)